MGIIDIIFGALLAWAAFKGFRKGLVSELASLLALIGGVFLAVKYTDAVGNYLVREFEFTSPYTKLISFVIIFIIVVVLVFFVSKFVSKLLDAAALGIANKILGLVFGILKSAFFISIFIFFLSSFGLENFIISTEKRNESLLYKPVVSLAPKVIPQLKKLKANFKDNLAKDNEEEKSEN